LAIAKPGFLARLNRRIAGKSWTKFSGRLSRWEKRMPRPLPNRRQALVTCVWVAIVLVTGAGLVAAAALTPAPPAALPFVIALCIGCPLLAAWELPIAVTVLRVGRREAVDRKAPRLDRGALSELRRRLDAIPETEHPLGY
jgi:hypothetical protein